VKPTARIRLLTGVTLGVVAPVVPLTSSAGAAPPAPTGLVPVPAGIQAGALPGATVFGSTSANTPE
jgi:hypothetical protein